jgi:hypothetical protein
VKEFVQEAAKKEKEHKARVFSPDETKSFIRRISSFKFFVVCIASAVLGGIVLSLVVGVVSEGMAFLAFLIGFITPIVVLQHGRRARTRTSFSLGDALLGPFLKKGSVRSKSVGLQKSGSVIALIGGIFATLSAIFTLILGGIGSAFDAVGATAALIAGLIGLILSFLIIVYGALAFFAEETKSYEFGRTLIGLSILGGLFLANLLVLPFLILSLVGGILVYKA